MGGVRVVEIENKTKLSQSWSWSLAELCNIYLGWYFIIIAAKFSIINCLTKITEKVRKAFQTKKRGNFWLGSPLVGLGHFWTWDFIEIEIEEEEKINLGLFLTWDVLKRNDPLKILQNNLNMKNVGTKSINMRRSTFERGSEHLADMRTIKLK